MASSRSSSKTALTPLEAKKRALNLKILKRHDANIVDIVESTSYVVLYRYEPAKDGSDDMAWVKTGMEGSMFLFRRSVAPHYGFFILNRHGVDSFCEDLVDENNLELTPEYIIFQSPDDRIHGIWVFEEEHRDLIGLRMMELCRLAMQPSNALAEAAASVKPSDTSAAGIRAQHEYSRPTEQQAESRSDAQTLPAAGQSISLDMLFGSAAGISQPSASAQPPPLPAEPEPEPQQSGLSLLDTLFASIPSTSTKQTSPTHGERIANATADARTAAQTDEDALRTLLGLNAPLTSAATHPPASHQSPQQAQPAVRQMPPAPFGQASSSGNSNGSAGPSGAHQQHLYSQQQRHPHQHQQPAAHQPPFAPQPQRVPQYAAFESPVLQARQPQQPQQQFLPPRQQPQAEQPQQQPPPPQQQSQDYQRGQQSQQQLQSQQQQQQRAQQPPLPSARFISAPLMPSVLLNKAKPKPSTTSAGTNATSALPPVSPSQSTAAQQLSASASAPPPIPLPSPSAPPLPALASPPFQHALPPHMQLGRIPSDDGNASLNRNGAQSIPPPPVPPVESRPPGSAGTALVSPPAAEADRPDSLTAGGTVDMVNGMLKRSHFYAAASSGGPALDRQTFRSQLVGLLQDARFTEALYQAYLGSLSATSSGTNTAAGESDSLI